MEDSQLSHFRKANRLFRENKLREAVKEYEKSLTQNEVYCVYENLGMALEALGLQEEAEKVYTSALRLNAQAARAKRYFEKKVSTDSSPQIRANASNPETTASPKPKTRKPAPDKSSLRSSPSLKESLSVIGIRDLLWAGFSERAIHDLHTILENPAFPKSLRAEAAEFLAEFAYYHSENEKALSLIKEHTRLTTLRTVKTTIMEIRLLLKTNRIEDAAVRLAQAHEDHQSANEWLVLESSLRRREALAKGLPPEKIADLQLAPLNQILANQDLAPIGLADRQKPLGFGNLKVDLSEDRVPLTDSPLVTVIMPAYNASAVIRTALEGLLAQTHRNLEILVADDCSDDSTPIIVRELAANDQRIRLIQLTENAGAYTARNAALREARGEWVMTHDTDDWSHPQKVERLLAAAASAPEVQAAMAKWLRLDENCDLVGPWRPKGTLFDDDFSSLLFRRSIVRQIGSWDTVRVGADTAFRDRIMAAFGKRSVIKLNTLLALSLTRTESLTRAEGTHISTMLYGLRWSYRQAYAWHLSRTKNFATPEEFHTPVVLVPYANHVSSGRVNPHEADLLVYAEFFDTSLNFQNLLKQLALCVANGKKIIVCPTYSFTSDPTQKLSPIFLDWCVKLRVPVISSGDFAKARAILIGSAALLEPINAHLPRIEIEHAFLLHHNEESISDNQLANARSWLGLTPSLVSSGEDLLVTISS